MPDLSHDDVIGLIYDAATDPALWPAAIQAVCELLGLDSASMSIIGGPGNEMLAQASRAVGARQAESVATAMADKGTLLSRTDHETAITDLAHFGGGPVAADLDAVRSIARHLGRAVRIGRQFERTNTAIATFRAAIDAIPYGAVLVDHALRIVHANGTAGRMLVSGDAIRQVGAHLHLADDAASARLMTLVATMGSRTRRGRQAIGIPLRRDGLPDLAIRIVPLPHRGERARGALVAVAAIFVPDTAAPRRSPSDLAGPIYGFTPAEARIFALAANGLSNREMAAQLGIATSTIRTHLLRVFAKTGCHRRAEVTRLARDLGVLASPEDDPTSNRSL